jgi:hypothetical protein
MSLNEGRVTKQSVQFAKRSSDWSLKWGAASGHGCSKCER